MLIQMITKEEIDQRIISLVAEWSRRDISKISKDTLINSWKSGGLAIDGADADDLIGFLANRLGWPLRDFDYDDYFGPELGWNPITLISMLIKGKLKKLKPLTVGLLIQQFCDSQPFNTDD
jgi:acyl carrier protein